MTRLPPDETNIGHLLQQLAGTYHHTNAFVDQHGQKLDFIQLFRYTKHINSILSEHGIEQEDRVALMMEQGMMMSVTCLSVMCGCVCVPFNPAQTAADMQQLCEKHAISNVIVSKPFVALARSINKSINIITVDTDALFSSGKEIAGKAYHAERPGTALILHTSGSTSSAKAVALTHRQLIASADNVLRSLELTQEDRCLNAMPPFHVGAVVDLTLAPLMAGGQVAIVDDANAETFWSGCQTMAPTWYQGVPTMLASIVDTAPTDAAHLCKSLRFIRAVSSKLPAALFDSVQQTLATPVIEIYGMTEAAGLICSNPLTAIKAGSVGVSAGPELMILDQHGNEASSGDEGEIMIRGDNVITAYAEGSEINRSSFINEWLRTGDRGYLDEDDYLFITGRSKEIINRGGEKISPLEIDMLLTEMPGVLEAAAFPLSHPTLGEDVAVAIVKNAGSNISVRSIQDYLKQKLAAYKLPQRVFFVDALPRAAGGKLKRYEIESMVLEEKDDRRGTEETLPDNKLARQLASEWKTVLHLEQLSREDNFFELGGDSLKAATLMNRLEKKFDLSLPTALLFDKPAFYQQYEFIRSALAENKTPDTADATESVLPARLENWLRNTMQAWPGKRLHTNSLINGFNTLGALPPLFWCCQVYEEIMPLIEGLGSDQPIYVMRSLNDIVKREKRDYPQLAQQYIREILTIQNSGPFYIGGYCGGARVAHEIATQLRSDGYDVDLLCLQENYINRPYSERVAMFCSSSGVYSPIGLFNLPDMGIGQLYTGDVALHQYSCKHAEFFRDAGAGKETKKFIQDLASELNLARQGQQSPARHIYSNEKIDTDHFLSSRISIITPRILPAESVVPIQVVLENKGNQSWQPSKASGITISTRLLNIRNGVKNARAGYAMIDGVIDAGNNRTISLQIETTKTTGLRYLEVDLLKEGVGWITNNNRPRFGKWIWVK